MENIKWLPVKNSLVFGAHYNYKVSDLWASTYGHGTDIDIWAAHLLSDTTGSHMVCTPEAVLFTQLISRCMDLCGITALPGHIHVWESVN